LEYALEKAGFKQATAIQIKAYPQILTGLDTIIAAETGSGKTLSYLLPLLQTLLTNADTNAATTDNTEDVAVDALQGLQWYPPAVILVPTKELAQQVAAMARPLLQALAEQQRIIALECAVDLSEHWPPPGARQRSPPSFLVCTPRFLTNYLRGPHIKNEGLFRGIRHVVFDEADMLLDGSFSRDVDLILDALKLTRRRLIQQETIPVHFKLVQFIVSAATMPSSGLKSIQLTIAKKFPTAVKVSVDHFHMHHPAISQQYIPCDMPLLSPARIQLLITAIRARTPHAFAPLDEMRVSSSPPPELDSAESFFQPPSQSLESVYRVEDLDDEDNSVVAHQASTQEAPLDPQQSQCMVFVNTAATAAALAAHLQSLGVLCEAYHSALPSDTKRRTLKAFQKGLFPVLVCTDSAARGLDITTVQHVIQAEFALNAVQHIHRVGRASRGGRSGWATNFYDSSSADLVDSLLAAADEEDSNNSNNNSSSSSTSDSDSVSVVDGDNSVEDGVESEVGNDGGNMVKKGTVEGSFSRRRGFRKRIKRQLAAQQQDTNNPAIEDIQL